MNDPVIYCEALSKTFIDGSRTTKVLDDVNFSIAPRERIAIVGTSGSGKSTLLHLLGGLDSPTSGKVFVGHHELNSLTDTERCQIRNKQLGFVYQFHHLLGEFSILENVCMPLLIRGDVPQDAEQQAKSILEKIGLQDRLSHRPGEISGGEKQRAAIARALVTQPACLLADEPTGNLDHRTAQQVLNILMELNQTLETSMIIVTHDPWLAKNLDRTLHMQDGKLTS